MVDQLFINLPVADLPRSIAFFTALGFTINPQWTDDTAACVVLGEKHCLMIMVADRLATFTPKPVANAHTATEVLNCLSLPSRQAVDDMVATALAHGGTTWKTPEDHGFMYGHAFADPDGHIWELVHFTPPPAQ